MLRADSDDDIGSEVVRKRHKADDNSATDLAQLRAYFLPPVHRHDDDQTKAPLSYACRFCHRGEKDPVRVSLSNLTGNLQSHRDGYTAVGRSDKGCPGRLKAKEDKSLGVPLSVAERRFNEKKKLGPLDGFVTTTPGAKFNNVTFNQMACTWL
ncbi:uncharacterized protein MELLADRAFT_57032, partial [Melampsora larici-populina 98AG31]